MSPRFTLSPRIAQALVFAVLLQCAGGCGKPSEDSRQNRRLVDSLLTAVTTGNQRQLEKCKAMLDERHTQGFLSDANHSRLNEIFDQARSGKSGEAEAALYAFRKSVPFPN